MSKRWMLLAVVAWPALAQARTPTWSISEASGAVTILHTGMSKVAARGASVMPGDVVRTGSGGRAVLVRGQEYMMVAPQSQVRLPGDEAKGAISQLVEEAGNVVFMIKKMATPHFAVQTPYLAAVVKGTTFSVSVDEHGASVRVLEGRVDVATMDGGAHQMVLPGGTASVGAGSLDMLHTIVSGREVITRSHAGGASSAVPQGAARPVATTIASVTPVDTTLAVATPIGEAPVSLAAVTGGLVSDGPAPALATASTSLKQLATVQNAAREGQIAVQQAIVQQNAAEVAASTSAAVQADAAAKAAAAASAARELADQNALQAAAQVSASAAAKQAADQATAQQATVLAAQQMQAAQQAAADAAARQAAAAASAAAQTGADAATQLAAQQAQAIAAAAAKQAADAAAQTAAARLVADKAAGDAVQAAAAQAAAATAAAAKLAAQQVAAQQAAAAAVAAQASAAAAAAAAAATKAEQTGGIIVAIVEAVTGKDKGHNGNGNGGVGNGNGLGNLKH